MSASALDNPVVAMNWKGQELRAEAGEFILALSPKAGLVSGRAAPNQVRALERALIRRGAADLRVEEYLGRSGQFLLDTPQGKTYEQVLSAVQSLSGFQFLEPNFVFTLEATPNDPLYAYEYGLHNGGSTPLGDSTTDADIDAPEAWEVTQGNGDVVIGVVDSGVDYTHPDLAANMWTNPFEAAGNGVDDDGNGYVDDVHGINSITGSGDPMDDNGHGTHAAGTIAAVGNNGVGVTGVAWDAQVMALKFLAADGSGSTADAIECLNYATAMRGNGVNIRLTSNSWGGGGFEQALRTAIASTADAGMLFVAAAGNGGPDGVGDNNDLFPSHPSNYDLPNVVAVAATDRFDALASFSNYGVATVDLAAPGVDIASTVPAGQYAYMSGTSMATPHVSGVAALAFSKKPTATYADVKNALLTSVDRVPSLSGKVTTGGRLNAARTLNSLAHSLSGTSFHDADGGGSRGGAEAALAGRTVYLDLNNNAVLDTAAATFTSADVPLTIPDPGTTRSTLTASGLTGVVTDVDVLLNLTHTYDADVRATLIGPTGRRVELVSAAGGTGDNFTNTGFDDEAATAIAAGAAPFTGRFRPTGSLADLDGESPNGTWTLEVQDTDRYDTGTLRGWSLTLSAGDPSRTTDAAGAYSFDQVASGTYTVREVMPAGWVSTAPAAGYHTVQVLDADSYAGRDFGSWVPATDPNDQLGEAFAVAVGTAASGTIGDGSFGATDVDMFSFTVVAGQRVGFDVDAAAGDTLDSYLRLFNGAGTQLAANNNGAAPGESASTDGYFEYTFGTAGTYYVAVSGNPNTAYNPATGDADAAGSTGAYTIGLVNRVIGTDADDQLGEARSLAVGTVASDSISNGTDVDMFKFTAAAGQRLAFDLDRAAGSSIDSYLRVFDSTGRVLAYNDNGAAAGESSSLASYLQVTFATPGTYFVGVSANPNRAYNPATGGTDVSGRGGGYTLAATSVATAATAARSTSSSRGVFSDVRVAAVSEVTGLAANLTDVLQRIAVELV